MVKEANAPSTLVLNTTDLPDLSEAFEGQALGSEVKVLVTLQLDEITSTHIKGAVKDAVPEGYKRVEMEDSETAMDAPPIIAVVNAKKRS